MVTPAKNEEIFLPKVIESVCSSSLIPELWIIVDDNSSDKTPDILNQFSKKYNFLEVLSLKEEHPRDLIFHYSYVCVTGFDYLIKRAKEINISWDYIVLLDADTIVSNNYFQCVLREMDLNSKVGIASGDVHIFKEGVVKRVKVLGDVPSGTARVWRKKCFFETGGYKITQAPDSVSRAKACLKGWEVKRFGKYCAYQLRDTSSATGLWKGFHTKGKSAHYLNVHPLLVILTSISLVIKKPYYICVAYLSGYLLSVFRKENQIDDSEIKDYFWNKRIKYLFSKSIFYYFRH